MSLPTPSPLLRKCSNTALLAAVLIAGVAGCETGTTHKTDLGLDVNDVTTKPPATAHAEPPNTAAAGQVPVPSSPTASNADGTQPPDDAQARNNTPRQPDDASSGGLVP
jgi:hypothetical protein